MQGPVRVWQRRYHFWKDRPPSTDLGSTFVTPSNRLGRCLVVHPRAHLQPTKHAHPLAASHDVNSAVRMLCSLMLRWSIRGAHHYHHHHHHHYHHHSPLLGGSPIIPGAHLHHTQWLFGAPLHHPNPSFFPLGPPKHALHGLHGLFGRIAHDDDWRGKRGRRVPSTPPTWGCIMMYLLVMLPLHHLPYQSNVGHRLGLPLHCIADAQGVRRGIHFLRVSLFWDLCLFLFSSLLLYTVISGSLWERIERGAKDQHSRFHLGDFPSFLSVWEPV
jgi:hypothetical protein